MFMKTNILSKMVSRGSIIVLLLGLNAFVQAIPPRSTRIVGGSLTTINQYPQAAALLYSWGSTYSQSCGGTIITARSVLTAAHCVYGDSLYNWRARVGSSWANSGGSVHALSRIAVNSQYNPRTLDYDVAILQVAVPFALSNTIKAGSVAGPAYVLQDNQAVWAIGWGTTSVSGAGSEQLRHVQIWSINQAVCRSRYAAVGLSVTDNMLCSGWLDVGGRDQCQGDSGGPLFHNGVVVGICSWGNQCALAQYPGVNTRVSRFTSWIQANAV